MLREEADKYNWEKNIEFPVRLDKIFKFENQIVCQLISTVLWKFDFVSIENNQVKKTYVPVIDKKEIIRNIYWWNNWVPFLKRRTIKAHTYVPTVCISYIRKNS